MQSVAKMSDVTAKRKLIQIKLNAIHKDLEYSLEHNFQMIAILR